MGCKEIRLLHADEIDAESQVHQNTGYPSYYTKMQGSIRKSLMKHLLRLAGNAAIR